ncbi:hypothetical protein B0H14DRAFT_3502706 [Mycena olivaceomarginata]|nr:hypothetical protein B0H14DRAFT_3502706 [Mycena olivaceomarginata]
MEGARPIGAEIRLFPHALVITFDLALGRAFQPAADFDVAQCIQQRLAEEDAAEEAGLSEEDEADDLELNLSLNLNLNLNLNLAPDNVEPEPSQLPPAQPPALPAAPTNASLSAKQRNKVKSRARRDRKRDEARLASSNPAVKTINQKRVQEGKANHLSASVDIADLPHSQPAWVGLRQAQDRPFEFTDTPPDPTPNSSDGLGGIYYTQEEVDALSGTKGFMYLRWLGLAASSLCLAVPHAMWWSGNTSPTVQRACCVNASPAYSYHPSTYITAAPRSPLPPSHEGHLMAVAKQSVTPLSLSRTGEVNVPLQEPGELQNNVANTQLTDELLASEYFLRIAHFASSEQTRLFFCTPPNSFHCQSFSRPGPR